MAKVIRHSIKERSNGWVLNLHYDNNTRRQLSPSDTKSRHYER